MARQGQHQVALAPDILTPEAVVLTLLDGQRMTSRPLGLVFHDMASGSNVWIAAVKRCAGQLLAPNVVVYPDAFEGLKAALRYTYTVAGFEQDVVLYDRPAAVAAWGLSPASTVLETWTEVFTSPRPQVTALSTRAGSVDERIEFGTMALGQGRAYFLSVANEDQPSLPVRTSWRRIGEREFLVEAVRYADAEPLLQRLVTAPPDPDARFARKAVVGREALLSQATPPSATGSQLVAAITPGRMSEQAGLVLDYTTLSTGQSDYVFQGDQTYFIVGTVNLSGVNNVLEGGCILKFTNSPSAKINVLGQLRTRTAAYRPAVFTSYSDNSVGDTVPGSTGDPTTNYCGYGLVFNNSGAALTDVRFSYLARALTFGFHDGEINVTHAQFIHCQYPVYAEEYYCTVSMDNALFYANECVYYGSEMETFKGQHLTVHQSGSFFAGPSGNCAF